MPPNGKKNVYEHIIAEIKRMIQSGGYARGEKLPSVRAYAIERKVNPNTVAKAYAELEKQGFIRIQPKQGAYVLLGSEKPKDDPLKENFLKLRDGGVPLENAIETLIAVYAETQGEKV